MNQKTYSDEELKKGLEVVDEIYGEGFGKSMEPTLGCPYVDETVANLFGKVWNRPGLSLRDRRLLVLGATAMLGREDLVQVQMTGALLGGDLTEEELEEACLQLAFYVGWGNMSATFRGVQMAKHAVAEKKKQQAE